VERGQRFRCQGPFRNYILAGTFAATLFPLMAGLWFQGGSEKWRAVLGTLGCVIATGLSNSSGPLLCFLAALAGLVLWPMRDRMYLFRRSVVVMVLGLAVVMKAPVWYLIARVSDLVGGGGWHRSYLIDQFVTHFSQWWLVGTSYTADWAPAGLVLAVDPNSMDITNHYVAQGLDGGLLMLGLFLAIIVCCFKIVGRAIHSDVKGSLNPKLLWTIGVALAAHCTAFFSICYFDQITVFWFWLLAVISRIQQCANPIATEDWQVESGTDAAEGQTAAVASSH
jgi:Na+-transporting methylmalonyl-CoA/oxaloacetate decarboxylase gamma subunit